MTSIAIAGLEAVTFVAIIVAWMATRRAYAARAALRAGDEKRDQSGELARTMEADSQLADDVAHDLSDLLTAITGHAELLIASLDPSGTAIRDADAIRRAALSASRLTRPLRSLTSGRRAPTAVIDVNAVTARTVAALQPMLGPTIDVTLTLDHDIKRIKVGASHLDEIVLTLCAHARDAMPHGGHLTVATTRHWLAEGDAASGGREEYVRIIVTDTGSGMSASAQPRPFVASDGGHAIGLTKVDAIVKQAGGRIAIESAAGGGTTFTIDLPAFSEPAAVTDETRAETRLTAHVLVVEDEPGMREFIRLVLARGGHEVVTVAGGVAALAALNRQPAISLMLVDVVMPEMDGYELVVEARKTSPSIHAVFISAFAPDLSRQPSGDGFLGKPFTSESLIGVVEKALAC